MIKVDIKASDIKKINKAMNQVLDKSPNILANAINRTATKVRVTMKNSTSGVPKYYRVKPTEVDKSIKIYPANKSSLKAVVRVKGRPKLLTTFSVSPLHVVGYNGKRRNPSKYKSAVMKGHGLKPLDKHENKPFVAVTRAGIIGVFSRLSKGDNLVNKTIKIVRKTATGVKVYKYKTKKDHTPYQKEKLQMHFGPSIPQMVKNNEVMNSVNKNASEMLEKRLIHEVNNIMRRYKWAIHQLT